MFDHPLRRNSVPWPVRRACLSLSAILLGTTGVTLSTSPAWGQLLDEGAPQIAAISGTREEIVPHVVSRWTIAADTALQAVNGSDLSTSIGLGLQYQSNRTEYTLIVRKGTSDTLADPSNKSQFGQFILAPAFSKVGASLRIQLYGGAMAACIPDCNAKNKVLVPNAKRFGLFVSADVGNMDMELHSEVGETIVDDSVTALSATAAAAWRLDDAVSIGDVSKPLALMLFIGPTARILGGSINDRQREALFNNDATAYFGIEGGGMVRFANFDLFAKASWLGPERDGGAVPGLSRLQFVPSVTFQLPFDIITATPKENADPARHSQEEPATPASAGDAPRSLVTAPPPAPAVVAPPPDPVPAAPEQVAPAAEPERDSQQ